MHQNAEERLELLHTISDIVGIEVEKRMHAFTDVEHFSVRDASMAKPASGPLTSEQDKKNPYINNLSPQSVRNKRRDTKKHFINMKKLLLLCALLVSVITLSGAANRSFRTTLEQWNPIGFTQASNGMTQSQAGAPITNRLTAGSAILPTVATAAPSGVLRDGSVNVITFTTTKEVGETVNLQMSYTGDAPTLSGLTVLPGSWTYTLTSQTVTITGDVTFFDCSKIQLTTLDVSQNTALIGLTCNYNQLTALDVSKNTALEKLDCPNNQLTALDVSQNIGLIDLYCNNNQLTTLDVSQNTALEKLWCNGNQIKGEEMPRLVNSLPDRTGKEAGEFVVVQSDAESNRCLKSDVAIAKSKNWNTLKYKFDPIDYVAYEGEEPIPYAVTLTKEGEGTLTATGAADLNAVPEGTELTIVATPADGYELKALTANGTDILATKKIVVTDNMAIKATFTKKSYTVTFTPEGEGKLTATRNGEPFTSGSPAHEGDKIVITAQPAEGYQIDKWLIGKEEIEFTPYTGQTTFECTVGTSDVLIKATFAKKTAADVVESSSVCLYPNPASTYVNVKGAKADALVRLYDANGSLRYEARTDADGTLQIDLSAYAEGTYLLRVGNDAQRLLIQR